MSVYFAKVGDYVKVGYSAEPTKRVRNVKWDRNAPAELDRSARAYLIHVVTGTTASRDMEAMAHKCLEDLRVSGEWFEDCQELRDFIGAQILETYMYLDAKHGWCSTTAGFLFGMPTMWREERNRLRRLRDLEAVS